MSFWDKFAGFYDIAESFNGNVYRKMTDEIRRLIPNGAVTLDCAAGTGALSVAAAVYSSKVVCTDMSAAMLEQAKKKCKRHGLSNVEFAIRDITALEDADDTYDVCIAGNVLHLLDDPQAAVRELARVTKDGGLLILPTFLSEESSGFGALLIKAYKSLGFKQSSTWSAEQYKDMLRKCQCGKARFKLMSGTVPAGFGVITVNKQLIERI